MKISLILLASLALVACGTTPASVDSPAPVVNTVKVPVPIPCVEPEEVPLRPDLISDDELLQLEDGDFVTALHIDRLRRDGYEARLEAAMAGCI